jgi:hypothetical protein
VKRDQKPKEVNFKPARVLSVSLVDASPEIKEQMRRLGKSELRQNQRIAHYKTADVDWQIVVDNDTFEMMEKFQGNLYMMSDKTVHLGHDSLHILIMGRSRGQEAVDGFQVGHSQDCRLYNCRDGLSLVLPSDNRREVNQKSEHSTSIYDGIHREEGRWGRWRSRMKIDGTNFHLYQSSKGELECANAYQIIVDNLKDIRTGLVNFDTLQSKRKFVRSFLKNVDLTKVHVKVALRQKTIFIFVVDVNFVLIYEINKNVFPTTK